VTGYDPRHFIASVEWRFARTMPENPHWYVVERDAGGEPFSALVAYIRYHGRVRRFRGIPTDM
jgi:CelD/BcsL family acetyltransferase involved in cellulose biosynthesis